MGRSPGMRSILTFPFVRARISLQSTSAPPAKADSPKAPEASSRGQDEGAQPIAEQSEDRARRLDEVQVYSGLEHRGRQALPLRVMGVVGIGGRDPRIRSSPPRIPRGNITGSASSDAPTETGISRKDSTEAAASRDCAIL